MWTRKSHLTPVRLNPHGTSMVPHALRKNPSTPASSHLHKTVSSAFLNALSGHLPLVMAPLSLVLLATAIGLCRAAPAADVLPRADPVKMTLQKHVLTDGAKPRNRARLFKGTRTNDHVARASSEGLQDYYLGTDLQSVLQSSSSFGIPLIPLQ